MINLNMTQFTNARQSGSMSASATESVLTWTWNGSLNIGALSKLQYDVTDIQAIVFNLTPTNAYNVNTYPAYVGYCLNEPTSVTTTPAFAASATHNSLNAGQYTLDVSNVTGNVWITINCPGWTCDFSVSLNEIASTYTIAFNANGGNGSMPNQSANVDEYITLDTCEFTKTGYVFAGWALSSSGAVVYQDGAEVINLAEADETVTLYAVWERASLKCKLQYNKSENNKAVKDIEDLREFDFKLKEQTSIIDPVLLITGDIADMLQANYMTIPVFGRSYFITNITSIRTGLVEITAHVDVLSSYIEYIRECSAIVHRQENKWNLYLDDGFFKTYQNPNIVVKKFPNGFTNQSFVLAVAGN